MEATFQWGGATYTVRRPTVRGNLTAQTVRQRLAQADPAPDPVSLVTKQVFSRFVTFTTVDGEGDVLIPETSAPVAELLAALAVWSEQDETFLDLWYDAMNRASAPVNAPDLTPDDGDPKAEAPTPTNGGSSKKAS